MDLSIRSTLWIVSGLLMAAGGLGVLLALRFSRPVPHVPRPAKEEPPARPADEKVLTTRKAAYRLGIYVFVGLAVLTAIEFWIASAAGGSVAFLSLLALVKAGVIVQYYMHLNSLWSDEEAH